MAMESQTGPDVAQMPFIKNLASSDQKLRRASLEALTTFLSAPPRRKTGSGDRSLTEAEARKLWTGLYYALWMTDRPGPQQALATALAGLAPRCLRARPACARAWLRAFWHVLGAQWTSIEALRLDKFMLLARRVLAAMIEYAALAAEETDRKGEDVRRRRREVVADVCREYCFRGAGDGQVVAALPLGLRLHVLDVWVDELDRAGLLAQEGREEDGDGRDVGGLDGLVGVMGQLVEALTRDAVKAVRERALESYNDERLPWTNKTENGEDDDDDDDDDEWEGIEN